MKTKTMKAVVASAYGGPEVLQVREINKPQPNENQVLVKVHATSATTADTMMLTGTPYIARLFMGLRKPKHQIPGTGFAGVVVDQGSQVTRFKPGDRVFGETVMSFGANAEYVVVSQGGVILPMPENLPFSEAASFCDGHLTSFNFLKRIAQIKPGQRVLINGASGSLGTSAVQLAKHFGANVTGVCSTRNVGLVKSLGADEVIDYKREDFTQSNQKYDIVYDTVGKSSFKKCRAILEEDGMYLSPVLNFPLLLYMIWTSIVGSKKAKFDATGSHSQHQLRNLLTDLVELFKLGKLRTVIDRQYPLEKIADAHSYISSGRKKGNVVIMVA